MSLDATAVAPGDSNVVGRWIRDTRCQNGLEEIASSLDQQEPRACTAPRNCRFWSNMLHEVVIVFSIKIARRR